MVEELSYNDIVQQYHNTAVLYKDAPAYVQVFQKETEKRVIMAVHPLDTMKQEKAIFNMKDFRPPSTRLGMVNIAGTVLYVARVPYRKMHVGLSRDLLSTHHVNNRSDQAYDAERGFNLCSEAFGKTMKGIYPSFEECLEAVKKGIHAMAFERQFAITKKNELIYKDKVVGGLPKDGKMVSDLTFKKGFEYLEIVIGDNCEQTLRTTRKA